MNGTLIWFITQWGLFAVAVLVLLAMRERERERHSDTKRELTASRRRLHECALHLNAARRAGQRLDPYIDVLIDRELRRCPRSTDEQHRPNARGTCDECGLCLQNVAANDEGRRP